MIEFFSYIGSWCMSLVSLWTDNRLRPYFGGASLLYVFISFWLVYLAVRILVIRPFNGSSLLTIRSKNTSKMEDKGDTK